MLSSVIVSVAHRAAFESPGAEPSVPPVARGFAAGREDRNGGAEEAAQVRQQLGLEAEPLGGRGVAREVQPVLVAVVQHELGGRVGDDAEL